MGIQQERFDNMVLHVRGAIGDCGGYIDDATEEAMHLLVHRVLDHPESKPLTGDEMPASIESELIARFPGLAGGDEAVNGGDVVEWLAAWLAEPVDELFERRLATMLKNDAALIQPPAGWEERVIAARDATLCRAPAGHLYAQGIPTCVLCHGEPGVDVTVACPANLTCYRPVGHEGAHRGYHDTVYSWPNSVAKKDERS